VFLNAGYLSGMPETPNLRPASPDEIAEALSFALRYEGRKRVNHADTMMARIRPLCRSPMSKISRWPLSKISTLLTRPT
jgi:hypothetical protein